VYQKPPRAASATRLAPKAEPVYIPRFRLYCCPAQFIAAATQSATASARSQHSSLSPEERPMSPAILPAFVSSTSIDLQPEREAARDAVLRMRATQFVGMEYFGSRDETTRAASLDEVDGSRLYVGIFAARSGSGITEAEYRRAVERGLPCFIYFKDDATIPDEGREADPAQTAKLDALEGLRGNEMKRGAGGARGRTEGRSRKT
jgi:hypothetical protein